MGESQERLDIFSEAGKAFMLTIGINKTEFTHHPFL